MTSTRPRAARSSPAVSSAVGEQPPSRSPSSILLVDDSPANLEALQSLLEGLGEPLVCARSGEEALRHLLGRDHAGAEVPRSKVKVFVDLHRMQQEVRRQALLLKDGEQERFAREKAEAATRARDEFLAIVSHDLRGPLSAIVTVASVLKSAIASGQAPPLLPYLGVVERAARQMDRLISDLVDVSQLESEQLAIRPDPSSAATLIDDAVAILSPVAELNRQRLEVSLARDFTVLGDRERILQVLSNLIGNSLKFTPPHGLITVSAMEEGRTGVFSVRDSGPGIAATDLPRLFDRHWKADRTRGADARPTAGLGLGLYISKGIIDAHGGQIWATSVEGAGAELSFSLPLAEEELSDAADARAPDGPLVLVIDDEQDLRDMLREHLVQLGLQVVTASDGLDAFRSLQVATPQLILLDMAMPHMDGLQFRERQLQDVRLSAIPTVVMSGDPALLETTGAFASAAILSKPIRAADLATVVRRIGGSWATSLHLTSGKPR